MKNSTLIAIIIILLIPLVTLMVYSGQNKSSDSNVKPTASASATPKVAETSASKVTLKTTAGDINLNLFPTDAPKTVTNFVTLGLRNYYNGIIFHRVIKDFMIQGGDPSGTGSGGESIYGRTFADEINSHKVVKGTLAMANAGPNTNGSQFFIVTTKAQPSLDGGYTVFGEVADDASMAVVTKIASAETIQDGNENSRPKDPTKITGMVVLAK